jgi:hypothetical protein
MTITLNGSGTITGISAGGLPDAIITQPELATGVAGTGPAFRAYQNSSQSLSGGVSTKVNLQAENFDTNSNFDTSNSRFTPTVAGYYFITGMVALGAATNVQATIRKNGSVEGYGAYLVGTVSYGASVTGIVYLNGSTDYVELFMYVSGTTSTDDGTADTYFSGALVRAA